MDTLVCLQKTRRPYIPITCVEEVLHRSMVKMALSFLREVLVPLCAGAASPWVLFVVLGTTIEGHKAITACPKEGYQDGEGFRGQDIWGAAEVMWFVQPREEKTEGRPDSSLQLPHDRSRGADVVYVDLCKVSDTVWHDILISKLKRCGFDGWITCWVRNWLDGCTSRVEVNGLISKRKTVISNVP